MPWNKKHRECNIGHILAGVHIMFISRYITVGYKLIVRTYCLYSVGALLFAQYHCKQRKYISPLKTAATKVSFKLLWFLSCLWRVHVQVIVYKSIWWYLTINCIKFSFQNYYIIVYINLSMKLCKEKKIHWIQFILCVFW